jgi:hypothetical protein
MSSTEQRMSKEAGAERSAGARNWKKAGGAAVVLTAGPRAPAAAPASAV